MTARLVHTADQVAEYLRTAGFDGYRIVVMGAIAMGESRRDSCAVNVNWSPGKVSHLSQDDGIWQINSYWYRAVFGWTGTPNDYLVAVRDPATNAAMAKQIWDTRFLGGIKSGMTWGQAVEHAYRAWNVYIAGAHAPYIAEAKTAAGL